MVLDGIVENMVGAVAMGGYEDFPMYDNKAGCYIVKFTPVSYTLQEDFDVYGEVIESGEFVWDAVYFSPLDTMCWHVKPTEAENMQEATVALRTVLHLQLYMTVVQDESAIPRIFFHENGC